MKLRIAIVMMISIVLALGLVGIASAQSVCDTINISAGTAQPGGTDTVCGDAGAGASVAVYFDATNAGAATADEYGIYCVTMTIPTDATAGVHQLTVFIAGDPDTRCPVDYVVEAAVLAPTAATPALPATLPSTGFFLIPAGGLLTGGLGTLLFRKRR